MHRPHLAILTAMAATLLASAAWADDVPAPAASLAGAAAWAAVVGNTVAGTTPDGPYTEFFAPDGTSILVDRDGRAAGRWSLRDAKLCTKVDDEEEECRALEVTGAAGAFTEDGGGRYPFVILPGNAKGL